MAKTVEIDPTVTTWQNRIGAYEREYKKWEGRVDKILKRYRDEFRDGRRSYAESRFNILWSNVQTLLPAVFARLPQPDVSRRFRDNDPVGRVAGEILERALTFEIDHYSDYRVALKNAIMDRFLGGRGTTWVRYEPHILAHGQPEDGEEVTGNIDEPDETLDYECTPVDYVYWKDFGHSIARTWEEVGAVWRKVYMTRDALVERFGEEIGGKVPLDSKPDDNKRALNGGQGQVDQTGLIYEIWDKENGKALWLSKTLGKILDEKDDPLQLEGFFPCPKPLFSTLTTDSLIPIPDFTLYQDQATELDVLADRIDGLIKALQIKGVYDAAVPELARLFSEAANNDLIPVKNWAAFTEKAGLKGAIDLVDLTPIFNALLAAYQAMENVKGQIYELTGIADIIRGQSDPNETLGAQQLKGSYASLRLRSMQSEVAQFATDILRIKAEIICTLYEPETILKIASADQLSDADKQLIPQALQLLKNEPLRNFRIDIAADSMVALDEMQEKQERVEFLTAVGNYIRGAMQTASQSPQIAPIAGELLKFGVRGFKVGKSIEGELDQAMDSLKAMAVQAQQNPPPNPEVMKIQAQQQQAQMSQQMETQKLQMQAQADAQKNQLEAQRETLARQHEAQLQQLKLQQDAQLETLKQSHAKDLALAQMEMDRWKAELDASTKIAVAEIQAKTTLGAAGMKLNAQGSPQKLDQPEMPEGVDLGDLMTAINQRLEDLMSLHNQPRVIERDQSGKAVSISGRAIQRGPDGKIIGLQ